MTSSIPEIQAPLAGQSSSQTLKISSAIDFGDYVMNAFKAKKKQQDLNPLHENLSAIGTTSALATLLSNSPNNGALISILLEQIRAISMSRRCKIRIPTICSKTFMPSKWTY